jgi:hypothetical protein
MSRTRPFLAVWSFVLAVLSGCGSGGTVWVTGKLVKGGAQYTPPVRQRVALSFVVIELKNTSAKTISRGDAFAAEVNQQTGTFTVPGPQGQGIPPGKYRVEVAQRWTREGLKNVPVEKGKRAVNRETDLLRGRFAAGSSPIVRTIEGPGEITIDLDQPSAG